MFDTYFSHDQLRRFLIAFGSLFNTIQIRRTDSSGKEVQRLIVPLEYAHKDKWLVRLEQDPNLWKDTAITVPRMSYEMTNIAYDGARKLNSLNMLKFASVSQQRLARLYVGVPYTLTIDLNILAKTQYDGLQIIEQIIPFFTPDLTFRLQTLPELGIIDQVPLTISSLSEADNYDSDFKTRRTIIWTMAFTMKVNFYGAIKAQGVIEEVIVDLYNSPLKDILDPPITLVTETDDPLTLEDQPYHFVDEQTPDLYLTAQPDIRVDIVANTITGAVTTTITDNADIPRR